MGYYDDIDILYGYRIPDEVANGNKPGQKSMETLEEIPLNSKHEGSSEDSFSRRWNLPSTLFVGYVGDSRSETIPAALGIRIASKYHRRGDYERWIEDFPIEDFDKDSLDGQIAPHLTKIQDVTGIDTSVNRPRIIVCYHVT